MERPRAIPSPLSLDALEGSGVVHGARWWARVTILLGAGAAAWTAVVVPDQRAALLTLAAATTTVLLVLSLPGLQRVWELTAGTIGVVAVVAAAALSGGGDSPLRHLVLLPVLYVAAAHGQGQVLWLLLLAAAGRLALVPTSTDAPTVAVAEVVVELLVAAIIAAAAFAMRVSLGRASRELERTGELHQALVGSHTNAVYVLDEDGRWLELNARGEEVLGYRAEELLGRPSTEIIAPEHRDETRRRFALATAGTPQTYESAVVTRDGTVVPVLVTNVRLSVGGDRAAVLGIASDLTATLRERLARRTLERRFERLATSTQDGIYVVRTDGDERQFLYVNPAMTQLTGVPESEWYRDARVGHRYVSPEDLARVLREHPRGQPYAEPVLLRWSHPDGDRWLEFRETPWEDDTGQVIGVQGIVHDVTHLVRQQEAADAALEREQAAVEHLRRVDEMKNAFLQSVSHELRTPLTSVVGLAETMESHLEDLRPEQLRLLLGRTAANARKLDRLLTDLLDVDRMARGVLVPNLADVDVADVAARVLEECEEVGGRVVADLQRAVLPADAPKVERIIENLVHNAVRHTPDGTPVWLRVGPRDGGAEIVVDDAGTGISPELVDVLFEPFTQGDASRDAPKPGTGIGLSLVARFTELHGGRVTVEERPGGGARFRVWLPARRTA